MMQQFIRDIFGDALGERRRLSIFAVPSLLSELFDDVDKAVAHAENLATQQNIYFGLGLIAGRPAGRGKAEDVAAIGALWADIDLASEAHPGKKLPATVDEAEAILARVPLVPSMLVHSGHGLHAYWLLDRPWVFQDAQDRARAATLARGWHGAVCSAAEALGWKLENLGDLARVLRLPGTWNYNGGGQPVEVRILRRDTSVRYEPGDFPLPQQPDAPTEVHVDELVLRLDAEPPAGKLSVALTASPLFERTWNRDRPDLADQSQSAYDLSLATIAALRGWSDQEIADLIIATRRRHGQHPDKALRRDYLTRTLAKARQAALSSTSSDVDISAIAGPQPTADPDPQNLDPGPMPADLLQVPGFISQVVDYTLRTAPYPQPALAFAAALTLQAFLAGRKVKDSAENRTNLYVLALANSGAGKDHPRKVNQRICVEAGLQDCLGDAFASGEGIEDRMFVTPSLLFQTDEIDGLMNAINRAGDARHESIMNVLLKMYTSSNAVYPMRVKAGKQSPGLIDQPSLCMFGTAVPKYYYEALSIRMLNNGFVARLLILEASKRGRGQAPVAMPLPAAIVDTARWWADFKPGGTSNLQAWYPQPVLVPATPAADVALEECRTFADDRYTEAEDKDDPAAMAIWARAYEKTRKLTLIHAVSESPTTPSIGEPAVRWAWRFVEYQTRRMLFMAAQHVADGEFDAKCKRMMEVLGNWRARRGDDWMPHWELSRRLKWSDKDVEEVRNTLKGQRRIDYEIGSTAEGGRVGQRYRSLV